MEDFNELFGELNVRMHRKQKKAFRDYVADKSKQMNYKCAIDKSPVAKNVIVGDIDSAKYVFTAHYDTPPRLPRFFTKHMVLYSILASMGLYATAFAATSLAFDLTKSVEVMQNVYDISSCVLWSSLGLSALHLFGFLGVANPKNYNDNTSGCYALLKLMQEYENLPYAAKKQVAFIFFDNEEKFLLGSLAHRLKHKKNYKDKTYINLDCVGRGDQMNLYHFGEKTQIVKELDEILKKNGLFKGVPKKSNPVSSMSDHFASRDANHVCMLSVDSENNKSIYSHIHSSADDKIDKENIDNLVTTINELPFIKKLNTDYGDSNFAKKKGSSKAGNNEHATEDEHEDGK